MKFGKEFTSQMVPEWEEAYMNYNHLKTILKDILIFRRLQTSPPHQSPENGELLERHLLYRAFSGLTTNRFNSHNDRSIDDDQVILVSQIQHEEQPQESWNYETMFFRSSEEGAENEVMFFRKLDDEFNKAICFYKRQVDEVMMEAEELNKQMDALFALRVRISAPQFHSLSTQSNSGLSPFEEIRELEETPERDQTKMVSLEILNHVKINVTPESALSTLKTIFDATKSDLSFSKREVRTAQAKLKQAFVEFHRKLRLLKSYCFLNQLAFSKIMKKYDKVTSRNASKAYLEMVKSSYLSQPDEVIKLMERVESAFITHFANANRSQGMSNLRSIAKRDKHRVTFLVGCFFGCSIALVVAIVLTIHARDLLKSAGRDQYMNNIFPLYSLFAYIVLHMLMYAANIYFWKRFHVNYTFIFGFKPTTELGYKEILLLSFALLVLTLAAVLSNLEMEMDERTQSFTTLTELVPLGLVTVVLLVMVCPFNIMYRSSRFFLIVSLWRCVCASLYKVTFPDFFLGDQLTSQVQLLRTVEFYICYYGWGDFKKRSNTCNQSNIYELFYIFIAVVPYWFRFLQCMRQVFEQKDYGPGMNGLKYLSTIVAVVTRTIYVQRRGTTMRVIAASSSGVATIYNTYWDMVEDWGLLCKNSKNPWLRDKLILPNKSVYFVAMVMNVILRLAWMQTVLDFHEAPWLHRSTMIFVVASLEIFRRGLWNFFRMENEHLNNVGKFRAFKSVPLPFSYDDGYKEL
ncbi:phosphate transporter PHO1 homolog 9-like isoform X2 [Bidens hawaiensis]|uniref:phosphate transporter PHO1 homolog 9-like isoform X2 n=1 Tax=Bidens hawaiensis TaxID=980011 RepID=UPI00404A1309